MPSDPTIQVLQQKLKDCEAKLEWSESHYAALVPALGELERKIERLAEANLALRSELRELKGLPPE